MQELERVAQTGDVAFLFSDIEGSTARWKMYPDTMPASLQRHDYLLREAILACRGVVFKTVGDAFCAAFESVRDATLAAVAAQRALLLEDWSAIGGLRVRMALHCGAVSARDGDFFGSTVNRVARLLSAGHGGQVLISADLARELGDEVTRDEILLRDLGRHRLKDFPELEPIYQLLAPELPDVFPPLRTVAERPSNLPHHLTALVGREDDLAHLRALIQEHRVVSLIGAGGVGKTSLALAVGTELLEGMDDGVWLAELAPVDAGAVVSTIASVFGVTSLGAGDSILDSLVGYLKNKSLLLIVDNCEHVTATISQVVAAIVRHCPSVRVLVTSRERLGIANEVLYRLPVLSVEAASELFAERARAHVPGFTITQENAPIVERICKRLDGIALAVELAAARLRVMSVAQLADRLAERFRLLTGGKRDALPHHQTLRALIDWSYELLSENEKALLRRSGLFPGGWTMGAVVEVCSDEWLEEWDVLDHIESLIDKSLVVAEQSGIEPRYRLLESTREYALERLEASGERSKIARKQAEYFLHFALRADQAWNEVNAASWIAPLNAELDNFRAALSWGISQRNDPQVGIRLFNSLEAFWWDAQPVEGRRWSDEIGGLLNEEELSIDTARYWLTTAGVALSLAREKRALEAADKALGLYHGLKDAKGVATAQRARGAALIRLGRLEEGESALREGLEVFRAHDSRRLIALALRTLGSARILSGDIVGAGDIYREALALSQSIEDDRGVQNISGNLAEIEASAGNYDGALAYANEALKIARARQDWVLVCTMLINTTAYLLALGRAHDARSGGREALDVACEIQSDIHFAVAVQHLAAINAAIGDAARAARLLGFVDAEYARLENAREPTEAQEYDHAMSLLGDRLSASDLLENLRAGANLGAQAAKLEALLT